MVLDHSYNASGSTFNSVGGNQINNYYNSTILNYCSSFSGCNLPGPLLQFTASSGTRIQRSRTTDCSTDSNAVFFIGIADRLISHISNSLVGRTDSLNLHGMERLLEGLQQILFLTGRAIFVYHDSPLGQSLANAITPEVERCCVLLSELLNKVRDTRVGLIYTRISAVWHQVFGTQWDELASFKRGLYRNWSALGTFLMALNSYVLFMLVVS